MTRNVALTGAGAGQTFIDGTGITGTLVTVEPSVAATMSGVTIQNGFAQYGTAGSGCGLTNSGTLTMTDSIVTHNAFHPIGEESPSGLVVTSGGIANTGALTLIGSSVSDNSDGSGASGTATVRRQPAFHPAYLTVEDANGGIYNSGSLVLMNSTVSGNSAFGGSDSSGGIANFGSLTVLHSSVNGNHGDEWGGVGDYGTASLSDSVVSGNNGRIGGLESDHHASLALTRVTVSNNSGGAIGGIAAFGDSFTMTDSSVYGNSGPAAGGIQNDSGAFWAPTARISGSTVSGNTGGGIVNYGAVVLTNSTISGNSTGGRGGGLSNDGPMLTLLNSTVSGNSAAQGGGIEVTMPVSIANTIVAGNSVTGSGVGPDCDGALGSGGYNLLGTNAGCGGLADGVNGDHVGAATAPLDPRLDSLKDNGGPAMTQALLPGSAAIDGGNPIGCQDGQGNMLTTDQRGLSRPDPVNHRCDIGAYEAQSPPMDMPTPTLGPTGTLTPTPTPTPMGTRTSPLPTTVVGTAVASATAMGTTQPQPRHAPRPTSRRTAAPPMRRASASLLVRYYIAGGVTTPTQRGYVDLLNPTGRLARVDLAFYFTSGLSAHAAVLVPPFAQRGITVADAVHHAGSFGLVVASDRSIIAQLRQDRPGRDGATLTGVVRPRRQWFLAEGNTGGVFKETVAILNPDARNAARVTLHVLIGRGRARDVSVRVAARTESLVDIARLVSGRAIGIVVGADRPIVVERTLTFAQGGYGLTAQSGAAAAGKRWLFADGATSGRFRTYLAILNPGPVAAHVLVRLYGYHGGLHKTAALIAPPGQRVTLSLNPLIKASGVANIVTSDYPVVVERSEYAGLPGGARVAGSDVVGATAPSPRWSFAGDDMEGKSEFLLLFNPSTRAMTITVTSYDSAGHRMTRSASVAPRSRLALDAPRIFRGIARRHGFLLRSTNGQGFIAEQTVFTPHYRTLDSIQGLVP